MLHLLALAISATALAAGPALPISKAAKAKLREEKITSLVICGSTQIELNKKALKKEWFSRNSRLAYALVDMPDHQEYRRVLAETTSPALWAALNKFFAGVRLVVFPGPKKPPRVIAVGGITSYFKASVKDCQEKGLSLHSGEKTERPICDEKLPTVELKFQDMTLDYEEGLLYMPLGLKKTRPTHCLMGERLTFQ